MQSGHKQSKFDCCNATEICILFCNYITLSLNLVYSPNNTTHVTWNMLSDLSTNNF